jgi:alpha-galactosidase
MPGSVKIAVLGAGSAEFSLGLVRDLCLSDGFVGSEVSFMDIDLERLEAVTRLACRYARECAVDLRFTQTMDRAAALRDADFVLNTAAGSHRDEEAQRAMWERYGYYRGVRLPYLQLELMLAIARDVERLCPQAWLLQSANPVFDGCTLMTRETGARIVGLCHGGHHGILEMARVLELDPARITSEAPGVNHCIWLTQFRYNAQDAYPLLDDWIAHRAEPYWTDHELAYGENQMSRAAVDLYHLCGLFPVGDTARFGGWQHVSNWWHHSDLEAKRRWYGPRGGFDSELGWSQYLHRLTDNVAAILRTAHDDRVSVTQTFPPQRSGEQIVPVMDALANDRQGIFQVNVPNRGALPGIADDVVVEVPAMVSRSGIQPLHMTAFPQGLLTRAILPKILEMEMNLEVFQTGNPRALLHQLLFDHRTTSLEHAITALRAVMEMPANARLRDRFGAISHSLSAPPARS